MLSAVYVDVKIGNGMIGGVRGLKSPRDGRCSGNVPQLLGGGLTEKVLDVADRDVVGKSPVYFEFYDGKSRKEIGGTKYDVIAVDVILPIGISVSEIGQEVVFFVVYSKGVGFFCGGRCGVEIGDGRIKPYEGHKGAGIVGYIGYLRGEHSGILLPYMYGGRIFYGRDTGVVGGGGVGGFGHDRITGSAGEVGDIEDVSAEGMYGVVIGAGTVEEQIKRGLVVPAVRHVNMESVIVGRDVPDIKIGGIGEYNG